MHMCVHTWAHACTRTTPSPTKMSLFFPVDAHHCVVNEVMFLHSANEHKYFFAYYTNTKALLLMLFESLWRGRSMCEGLFSSSVIFVMVLSSKYGLFSFNVTIYEKRKQFCSLPRWAFVTITCVLFYIPCGLLQLGMGRSFLKGEMEDSAVSYWLKGWGTLFLSQGLSWLLRGYRRIFSAMMCMELFRSVAHFINLNFGRVFLQRPAKLLVRTVRLQSSV